MTVSVAVSLTTGVVVERTRVVFPAPEASAEVCTTNPTGCCPPAAAPRLEVSSDHYTLAELRRAPGGDLTRLPRRASLPLACRHLGAATGHEVPCAVCPGKRTRARVYACAVFGACTTHLRSESLACCRGCPRYEA